MFRVSRMYRGAGLGLWPTSNPYDLRAFARMRWRHRGGIAERQGCEGREGFGDTEFLPCVRTAQPRHRRADPTAPEPTGMGRKHQVLSRAIAVLDRLGIIGVTRDHDHRRRIEKNLEVRPIDPGVAGGIGPPLAGV